MTDFSFHALPSDLVRCMRRLDPDLSGIASHETGTVSFDLSERGVFHAYYSSPRERSWTGIACRMPRGSGTLHVPNAAVRRVREIAENVPQGQMLTLHARDRSLSISGSDFSWEISL